MSILRSVRLALLAALIGPTLAIAHDDQPSGASRIWTHASGSYHVEGSFVAWKNGQVQIRTHDGELVNIKLEALSHEDRQWVQNRHDAILRINTEPRVVLVSQKRDATPRGVAEILAAFKPFEDRVKVRHDDDFVFIESDGIPDHPMMIGIRSWQQQVPLPQKYVGDNAWRIPLHPVPARSPISARNHFLRGAIALAPNGVPIFNPLNNRGDDAYLFGELDEYGGHCGRADDYHYHLAPVHLEKMIGKGLPIAFALDGYPIYGFDEPDGSKVARLDAFNGHEDAQKRYHYHASKAYPYLNGGFHGEVVERGGQVDPQPRAEPIREAGAPLRGAKITDFKTTKPGSYSLTYDLAGRKNIINYTIASTGSVTFQFIDSTGKSTTRTYQQRGRRPGEGGGAGNRAEAPPDDAPPPPPPGGRRPPPPEMAALDLDGNDELSASEIALASKSLLALDKNGDGQLTRDELRPARPPDEEGPDAPPQAATVPTDDFGSLVVSSPAFKNGGKYPVDFTCDGDGDSPPIAWSDAPRGTTHYALSVWHVPQGGGINSYWVVYNIPVSVQSLPRAAQGIGQTGQNDKRNAGYDPMCSQGPGPKTYHITVYALSKPLDLAPARANRAEMLRAMTNVKLAQKTLTFVYERNR